MQLPLAGGGCRLASRGSGRKGGLRDEEEIMQKLGVMGGL